MGIGLSLLEIRGLFLVPGNKSVKVSVNVHVRKMYLLSLRQLGFAQMKYLRVSVRAQMVALVWLGPVHTAEK